MKAIIDKKTYNTETATEIAHDSNGAGYGDFRYWEETLYRTPKGNWFTVGGGGPMSKYARPVAGGATGGDKDVFIVLSENEAYDWLERAEETTAIENYFAYLLEEA